MEINLFSFYLFLFSFYLFLFVFDTFILPLLQLCKHITICLIFCDYVELLKKCCYCVHVLNSTKSSENVESMD